jgi:aspartyl aminopeptidase
MAQKSINAVYLNDLMEFLGSSPTPFHAVLNMENRLKKAGYIKLNEEENWNLKKNGKYFVTKNDRSIVAFKNIDPSKGFRITGAHTDSPCLKLKPNPDKVFKNYYQLGVEIYGGVLLAPWFDRDLSLAGRISYLDKTGKMKAKLLDFKRPVASVPSLAIHLDRNINENRTINKQKEMPPLLANFSNGMNFKDIVLAELKKQKQNDAVEEILDFEMYFYDTQGPSIFGLNEEFLASARLDNLLSCYAGLSSLLESKDESNAVLVCNDHEEVGSESYVGAGGPFLKSVLERVAGPDFSIAIAKSIMISCDNAHAIHPNYGEKHDENHGPLMNQGPVIKINSNQRYATNGDTSAIFSYLCKKAKVPFQKFVTRADMACGSTIGPITSTLIGFKTVDVGIPQLAMHSIREVCGVKDPVYLHKVLVEFYNEKKGL